MAGAEGPTYREYPPSSALATAVQCFWTMTARGATPFTNRVLPDRRPPRGIREFKALAGLAPRAFAAERAQVGLVQDGAAAGA